MPIPSSGQISFEDLNIELGNTADSTLDMDSAAAEFGLTRPHSMDEFYGLSSGYNFRFDDWNGFVSITEFGVISASPGNAGPVTINTSNFDAVTSNTVQTINVTITAPAEFGGQPVDNAGSSLTGDVITLQSAVNRYLDITVNDSTLQGPDTSLTLTVSDIYYTDTDWTITEQANGVNGLDIINPSFPRNGNGDDTISVFIDENTSGNNRSSRFTVTAFGGSPSDFVDVGQVSYTPVFAPTVSIGSVDTWNYNETTTKALNANVTGGSTPTVVRFNLTDDDFKLVNYGNGWTVTNPYGPVWQAVSNNPSAGAFTIYVQPTGNNGGTSDKTAVVSFTAANDGGSDTETFTLRQKYQVLWNTDVSSLSWNNTNYNTSQTITLNTSFAWTATVSNSHFSINSTSGNAGTHVITIESAQSDLGENGNVTFSATGQNDIVVSLQQSPEPVQFDWFVNGLQRTGTSLTVSPSTISTSYSVGLYAARGSTPSSENWQLDVTSGEAFIDVNTTTSGGSNNVSTNTSQNTNGTPYLYINVATNTSSARNGLVDILTEGGSYFATIEINQSGTSGGTGPGDKEKPIGGIE